MGSLIDILLYYICDVEKGKMVTVNLVDFMCLQRSPQQTSGKIRKFSQMFPKNMQYTLKMGQNWSPRGLKICKFPPGSDQFSPQKYANFPLTYEGASRGLHVHSPQRKY